MLLRYKKIIFLLPPKTGSTSFKKMLQENKINFEEVPNQLHPFLSEIIDYFNIKNIEEYSIYQICRNPFDRISSSFYFQKKIIKNKDKYKNFIDLDFKEFIYLITKNLSLVSSNIDLFCKNVFNDSIFHIRNRPSAYGVRFYIPQSNWKSYNNIKVTYLKIEDLDIDTEKIKNILNTNKKLILPKVNKNNLKSNYDDLYDNEIKKIVKNSYKNDFIELNY